MDEREVRVGTTQVPSKWERNGFVNLSTRRRERQRVVYVRHPLRQLKRRFFTGLRWCRGVEGQVSVAHQTINGSRH